MKKELRFKLTDQLNSLDTETQTYGCRANNPDICKNCMTQNICAFVREDNVCKMPSRKWKVYYQELLKNKDK